jgi:hypothetical protein
VRARILFLVIAVTVVSAFSLADAQATGTCPGRCDQGGSVYAGDGALITHVGMDGAGSVAGSPGSNTSSGGWVATGPVIEYRYSPVCDGACDGADAQATSDTANCTGEAVAVWVTSQTVGSGTGFTLNGPPECLTAAEQMAYDPAQLQAMVAEYFKRIPLPEPGLHIAPADNAVVNLPEIVSADAPPTGTFTVNQAPFPIVIITASVQWEWDFGDGATLITDSPGKAYDGTDPAGGGYLLHTYKTVNKAWPLSVTSVWTATYTVQGVAGTQTVADAVTRTTTHPLASAEYGSVLTGN